MMETLIWFSLGGGGGVTSAVDLTNCFFEMENIVVVVVVGSMSVHDRYGLNTSSQLKTVQDPFFSLENLQPGRNYSISVRALSNNIESLAIQGMQ